MRDRVRYAPAIRTDQLERREGSRLWFRAVQPARMVQPTDHATNELRLGGFAQSNTRVRTGPLRSTDSLQAVVDGAATAKRPAAAQRDIRTLTEWADAPRHCPVLLLSANQLMDAPQPGPMLGPGTRYRIVSVADGIACVQVRALDGEVGLGYCKALDLLSYEPEIMYLRSDKRGLRLPNLKLGRRPARLAGATG